MAKNKKVVSVYISPTLFNVLETEITAINMPRSVFIENLLIEHFCKGDNKKRLKLMSRDKGEAEVHD